MVMSMRIEFNQTSGSHLFNLIPLQHLQSSAIARFLLTSNNTSYYEYCCRKIVFPQYGPGIEVIIFITVIESDHYSLVRNSQAPTCHIHKIRKSDNVIIRVLQK